MNNKILYSIIILFFINITLPAQRSLATLEDDMVLVEGGSFIMGGRPGRDDKNGLQIYFYEQPPHEVRLPSFYICKYEVTQQLWQEVMGSNPASNQSCGSSCPVENVSWYDAIEFCNQLSIRLGLRPCYIIDRNSDTENQNQKDNLRWRVSWNPSADGYRLPCEAEWEYAARGGSQSKDYSYSGSDNIDEVAWNSNNSGWDTHPVSQKKPNELGMYDFSGNVWEWIYDMSGDFGYNPYWCSTDGYGAYRSRRGGSSRDFPLIARLGDRGYSFPLPRYFILGLRLSRSFFN